MASNLIKTKESIQNPASKSSSIEHLIDLDVSSFSTSMIILSILAVPLLVIIIVVSIIRLRQRGK